MTTPRSDLVPAPALGRIFRAYAHVRLGDVSPGGRARLDALARYAQDIAGDDSADAAVVAERAAAWVVRRTVVQVDRFPAYGEKLALSTWCSGTGSRWAERRTSMRGGTGKGAVELAAIWVLVDLETGRPLRLPERFDEVFAAAAGGREVKARLTHPPPPTTNGRRWPLRFSDFDVLGHMNNAAYWSVVEEELARRRDLRAPLRAELEFGAGIEPDWEVDVVVADGEDGSLRIWLVCGETIAASVLLS